MRKPPSARSAAVAVRLAKPGSSVTLLVRHEREPRASASSRPIRRRSGASERTPSRQWQIILPRAAQVNRQKSRKQGFYGEDCTAIQSRRPSVQYRTRFRKKPRRLRANFAALGIALLIRGIDQGWFESFSPDLKSDSNLHGILKHWRQRAHIYRPDHDRMVHAAAPRRAQARCRSRAPRRQNQIK